MAYNEQQGDPMLDRLLTNSNIAEGMDKEEQEKIAEEVWKGYETDLGSRREWEDKYDEWLKLAMQVKEKKNYPWPGASNVKFPLLSTASMQFAARAYPALVPSNGNVVNYRVIGSDPQGMKAAAARRVSQYMSWQVLERMPAWEEDMDRMLIMLPIVGTAFKKTFYKEKTKQKCSILIHAKDLVVNYWATSLEDCERKTQKIRLTERQLEEKMRAGEYLKVELPEPSEEHLDQEDKLSGLRAGDVDEATPYLVLEQHRFLDLDDDGYAEPYVVTILAQEKKLLRIVARWDSDGVYRDEKGKVVCITPVEYYTKYGFIPNPDGGFYDLGFGLLLGSLNESANTLINQLVDSGTLSNLQAGWISKGLKIKQGNQRFTPGEWKQVDATLDDIKKGIFPMPVREPSEVLFQLLGMIVTSTKELASVAEIFTGKMPGQNTPAYTTKETVEQGMKVFTAIYKRLYRAMAMELKKLYRLNQIYLNLEEAQSVTDDQLSQQDFQGPADDIVPAADPQAISQTDKISKARSLGDLIPMGLDPNAVATRILEAMEVANFTELFRKEPPPPPPEVQKLQMEGEMKQKEMDAKMKMAQEEHQLKMQEMQAKVQATQQELQAKIEFMKLELEIKMQQLGLKAEEIKLKLQQIQVQGAMDMQINDQKMQQQGQQHQQSLEQQDATHKQKMQQAKEAKKMKPKGETNGSKGNEGGTKGLEK